MSTIYVNQLIKLFKQALNEGWGYIWGAAGETWTQSKQNAETRSMTVKYGQKWVGKRVADCSGLFSWAFKSLGGYMYHGSNTMWKQYCTDKGTLTKGKRSDGQDLRLGSAVFMCKKNSTDYYHVGLYIGNNEVIEAKGTKDGVVKSKVSNWTHWGELKGVAYDSSVENNYADISLGDRILKYTSPCMEGNDIKELQTKLNVLGYACGSADGIFGTKTMAALKRFQLANRLDADGIFGPDSLYALQNAILPDTPPEITEESAEPMPTYEVQPGDTLWKISKKLFGTGSKYKQLMTANGLTSISIKPGMKLTIPDA